MTLELTSHDMDKLRRVLRDLLAQAEADSCLVCDQAGYVLIQLNLLDEDPLRLSALGAGVFAATRELARIIGEDEFSTVLHQGERRSILIEAVDEQSLVVVLFTGDHKVGLVKLYAPAAAAAVRRVLNEARARQESDGSTRARLELRDSPSIFGTSNTG